MESIAAALTDQHAELDGLLSGLDDGGWSTATRCAGWNVSDVVLHLAQTDAVAVGSLKGDFEAVAGDYVSGIDTGGDIDDIAGRAVEHDRGQTSTEICASWRRHAARLRSAVVATPPQTRVLWVAGDMAARTLATTRLAESWIHTEDVADALGVEVKPSDRLYDVARLAWRTVPYAFTRASRKLSGPVAFELEAPGGDTWAFVPEDPPATVVTGPTIDLCRVAGQRLVAADSGLTATGADPEAVLELVRTFA